jgi:hypothetical protein
MPTCSLRSDSNDDEGEEEEGEPVAGPERADGAAVTPPEGR